jgi:protein-tyrosine phosphatase
MWNHKFNLSIILFVFLVEMIACADNRILPLEGALNARDLGGYASADGNHVKWGMIFRTGDLKELTDTDLNYLNQIQIKTIIDFRDSSEVASAPDKVPVSVVNQFYLPIQPGNVVDLNEITPEVAPHILVDVNKMLVSDFQPEYKAFFQLLMNENNAPLLFHCSAGKDRTGFASALFLASLGVDTETIIQDYLLSKKYVEEKYSDFVVENPVFEPLMTVKREYIEAALDLIDKEYGGMGNYLTHNLQVDTLKMRKIYTE